MGKQFVRAADSIALNIAEGYGRFFFKENKNFNYYSRGSAFECTACLHKAFKRKLISEKENKELRNDFALYFKLINAYIKSIGTQKDIEAGPWKDLYECKASVIINDSLTNDLMTIVR